MSNFEAEHKRIETEGKPLVRLFVQAQKTENTAERNDTFDRIVNLVLGTITGYLRSVHWYIENQEDLEEACQEFLLKLFSMLKHYKDEKALVPFLFVVARSAKADYGRKSKVRKKQKEDVLDGNTAVKKDPLIKEALNLEEELAVLSESDRTIFILYYVWDYSLEEIAELLGESSPKPIRNRLRAILRQLRKEHQKRRLL